MILLSADNLTYKIQKSILPVCDKPYQKIKESMSHGEKLENLWNYQLVS